MARTFEDLEVWKDARRIAGLVYRITGNDAFAHDFGLKGQIQRSSVSVMSNIAEGFGRGTNADFKRFLFMARGSLSEANSQLYVAKDLKYLTHDEFLLIDKKIKMLSRRLTALINKIDTEKGHKSFN